MASNQTQNYALPQWQGTDPFSMAEFNDTFAKIDTAIANVQSKADEIAAKSLRLITGTYTGDGTASRKIDLGATPKLVFVAMYGALTYDSGYFNGGLATQDCPTRAVAVVEGGFQLTHGVSNRPNSNDTQYAYFALI